MTNPPELPKEWEKGLRQLPQLYKASEGDIVAIEAFIRRTRAEAEKRVTERAVKIIEEMRLCVTDPIARHHDEEAKVAAIKKIQGT